MAKLIGFCVLVSALSIAFGDLGLGLGCSVILFGTAWLLVAGIRAIALKIAIRRMLNPASGLDRPH